MDSTHVANGTIVVGIDGSPAADLALDWAADQATLEHRALTVAYASGPVHPVWLGPPALDFDDMRASASRHAHAMTEAASARVRLKHPGLQIHRILSETDPREELLNLSRQAAMVVLGSRGRGPVASLLLGSVSAAVAGHAVCPVVVVRPDDPDFPRSHPHHGVLVSVLRGASEEAALELAFGLASSRGLRLTVLDCFWDADGDPADPAHPSPSSVADLVAAGSVKFPDVEVALRPHHGFVDQQLIDLSASMDAVVVGTHHPNLMRRGAYGSLAMRVLEHAHGAVVVVPLTDDHAEDRRLRPARQERVT